MMKTASTNFCPASLDDNLIRRFSSGRLNEVASIHYAAHVETCPACQKRLADFCRLVEKESDPLVDDLRRLARPKTSG